MFGILHWDGSGESNPSIDVLPRLYDELRSADKEHGDVSVINDDSAWCLTAHRGGKLIFENLSTGERRHIDGVTREATLDAWRLLIENRIEEIEKMPWLPGY